jgi:type I restriction enzyme S subunit
MDYAKIGDTCLVGDGTHSKIQRHDSGALYLTSRNFKDGNLDLSKVYYISESDYAKHFLNEGKALACPRPMDLVFSIIGTIGEPYLVRASDRWGISSSVAIVRPKRDVIDPAFLLYWFKGPVFQSALFGIKGGVAQGYVSLEMIRSLPVPMFPLSVQQRIAGILSAYDELIENSQRRIRILESMARALYREWFVHFRFPGFEHHPRVASPLGEIPQGWEVKEMQEIADVIDCLHSKKPSEYEGGQGILLQLNNIGEGGKLDMREQFRVSAEDYRLWTSRIELRSGDCVVTNVGRVGAVAQIPEGVVAAPGRKMTAIRARTGKLTPTYLIEYLLSSHMTSEVAKKKDLGTIMDSLNVNSLLKNPSRTSIA